MHATATIPTMIRGAIARRILPHASIEPSPVKSAAMKMASTPTENKPFTARYGAAPIFMLGGAPRAHEVLSEIKRIPVSMLCGVSSVASSAEVRIWEMPVTEKTVSQDLAAETSRRAIHSENPVFLELNRMDRSGSVRVHTRPAC